MKRKKADETVVPTGVKALDVALKTGGFRKGSIILFVGDPGSRKDLFGYHFLLAGLEKGEQVAFYDVEASSDEIMDLMNCNVDDSILANLDFVNACPEYSKFFIQAVPARILEHMGALDEKKVNRVLINPLTFFLEKFGMRDAGDFIILAREIAMKKGMAVVFLMADILPERDMQSVIDKVDGVIDLRTVKYVDGMFHTLSVRKVNSEHKNIELSYNTEGTNIMFMSTGRIV